MAKYDFSTLNSSDLEELACDLLNAQEPSDSIIKYRTFKDGRDQGIDFLYSTSKYNFEHVGQVKHYIKSGYPKLLSSLKKEVDKVKKLKPNKYILVTSLDLSPDNCVQIKNIFDPYIDSLSDIYGKDDLNRLIELNNEVLKRHFKLWFADTSVLKLILNSEIVHKSIIFEEFDLKKRLRLYVETSIFHIARNSLKSNNFIIITGVPGVGKTTLAEMLVYEYLKDGYNLTYIEEIGEADNVLSKDESKHLIYFDDFLGSNKVEINKAKGSETKLRRILRTVTKLQNKVLIMTTRTFLLNTAIQESEHLKRFNISAQKSIINIDEYNTDIKEKIIINHIENSNINDEKKKILASKTNLKFMSSHEFFNPRSVEFVTNNELIDDVSNEEFEDYIRNTFDSPDKIWNHAYHEQITDTDRILLNTLLSFKSRPTLIQLKRAYEFRIEKENKSGITVGTFLFDKTIHGLMGGFIKSSTLNSVDFINPSLKDFLVKKVLTDNLEFDKISRTISNVNQLFLVVETITSIREILPLHLKKLILESLDIFAADCDDEVDLIHLCTILLEYFDLKIVESNVYNMLETISDWRYINLDYLSRTSFDKLFAKASGSGLITSLLQSHILEIIEAAAMSEFDPEKALESIRSIKNNFNINLLLIETPNLDYHISELINEKIDAEVDFLKEFTRDEHDATELKWEIENLIDDAIELGLDLNTNINTIYEDNDWYDIANTNEMRIQMEKKD